MSKAGGQTVASLDVTGLNCVEDAWLSLASGFRCFEVHRGQPLDFQSESPSKVRMFFTAKVETKEVGRAAGLIRRGFDLVDTSLTLLSEPELNHAFRQGGLEGDIVVDAATEADLDAVESIAESAFRHSRFHRDPRFPSSTADQIKRVWAANLVTGHRGAGCLVGRRNGRVVSFLGYLQVESPRPVFVIDLVAVSIEERGRGMGRATVGAMQSMAARHKRPIIVGTQVSNVASVRMYEAMGFCLESSAYILHGHLSSSETP